MKKITKISLTILGISFIVFTLLGLYVYLLTKDVKLQQALLNDNNYKIVYLDCNLDELETTSNGVSYTSLNKIPSHVQKSFIAIEDKRFYTHKGIDHKAILRATINNVKSFSYKEGGSTISQQLIKNTHLTNEKTLKRKIAEIKLSKILENKSVESNEEECNNCIIHKLI
jgi:penicillin-binding protein 1A